MTSPLHRVSLAGVERHVDTVGGGLGVLKDSLGPAHQLSDARLKYKLYVVNTSKKAERSLLKLTFSAERMNSGKPGLQLPEGAARP